MPVYQVITAPDLLSDSTREAVAREITAIHTNHTGAPPLFVNVVFQDLAPGRVFTAGEPSSQSFILGQIRAGRELEIRQAILRDLIAMWTTLTGQSEREVLLGVVEVDARSAMEAGLIMPGPGEEAAWFATNRVALTELGLVPADGS